jgi:hypothetical protein
MKYPNNFQCAKDIEGYLTAILENPQFSDRAKQLTKLWESVQVYNFKQKLNEIPGVDTEASLSEIAFNTKLAFVDNSHKVQQFLDEQIRIAIESNTELREQRSSYFWKNTIWNYVLIIPVTLFGYIGFANINHWINWDNDKILEPTEIGSPDVDYYKGNDHKFNTMQLNRSEQIAEGQLTETSPSTSSSPSSTTSTKPESNLSKAELEKKIDSEYYELVVTSPDASRINVVATFSTSKQNVVPYSIPLTAQTDNKTGKIGIIKISRDIKRIDFISEEK